MTVTVTLSQRQEGLPGHCRLNDRRSTYHCSIGKPVSIEGKNPYSDVDDVSIQPVSIQPVSIQPVSIQPVLGVDVDVDVDDVGQ